MRRMRSGRPGGPYQPDGCIYGSVTCASRQRPVRPYPTGRISWGVPFQALRARLRSLSPYGTQLPPCKCPNCRWRCLQRPSRNPGRLWPQRRSLRVPHVIEMRSASCWPRDALSLGRLTRETRMLHYPLARISHVRVRNAHRECRIRQRPNRGLGPRRPGLQDGTPGFTARRSSPQAVHRDPSIGRARP